MNGSQSPRYTLKKVTSITKTSVVTIWTAFNYISLIFGLFVECSQKTMKMLCCDYWWIKVFKFISFCFEKSEYCDVYRKIIMWY